MSNNNGGQQQRNLQIPSPPLGVPTRPGSWPQAQGGGAWSTPFMAAGGGGGPTVNIPDSRFGYTSPIPSNIYGQVGFR